MELPPRALDRVVAKYSEANNLPADLVERIAVDAVRAAEEVGAGGAAQPVSPFAISWMDSYLAHWELRDRLRPTAGTADEVERLARELIDVRFAQRLAEIRDVIRGRGVEPDPAPPPPDGGPPPEPGVPPAPPPVGPAVVLSPPDLRPSEPGVPPVGPAGPFEPGVPPVGPAGSFEPPDGGPPEPGVPPVGPASLFEPPDGGPPEPGVPPVGPAAGLLEENPWILYWFVSVKAPLLLDVIDAHLTRRLGEIGAELR